MPRNIMLVYEHRMPDMAPTKLNDRKRQPYPNSDLKRDAKVICILFDSFISIFNEIGLC